MGDARQISDMNFYVAVEWGVTAANSRMGNMMK